MDSTKIQREDVYLEAFKVASDELAELLIEQGNLEGRTRAIKVHLAKCATLIAVYEKREKSNQL